MKALNNINKEEHDQQWRMKEINRQFFKGDKKTFDCEICYDEKPINEISYLQCVHYFCRECLTSYMKYMID
jgi:late competence protein required for DNA uptake (superfamily II DNA/RNA helicase)